MGKKEPTPNHVDTTSLEYGPEPEVLVGSITTLVNQTGSDYLVNLWEGEKNLSLLEAQHLSTTFREGVDRANTWRAYPGLAAKGYVHRTVKHGEGEFVRGKNYINGLEGFWGFSKENWQVRRHTPPLPTAFLRRIRLAIQSQEGVARRTAGSVNIVVELSFWC